MRAGMLGWILAAALPAAAQDVKFTDAPGHWPQWRGPNRDNVSTETGLLRQWPDGGPKLLWTSRELADGFPPVSVAGGRIYGIGYRNDRKEYVTSLDGQGRVVWTREVGLQAGEFPQMRFVSQRSVTVSDDLLYAFTATGKLVCLRTSDGKPVWEKSYPEIGGQNASFSWSDAPLVEGQFVIGKPGGSKGSLAALLRGSGAVSWQSGELKDPAASAPIIRVEIGGVPQYIVLSHTHVAGIVAKTGKLAWIADRAGQTAVLATPIYHDGILFVSSGFGVGCDAFRISADGDGFKAERAYFGKQMANHRGGLVRVGEHVYGYDDSGGWKCLELKTGKVVWQDWGVSKGSLIAAEGLLVLRSEGGRVALVEASPEGYKERGRFEIAGQREPCWSQPVIAGGRLYLRDPDLLFCYDLRGPDYREPPQVWKTPAPPAGVKPAPLPKAAAEKGSDAAFVPTPPDVVTRMLNLAGVGNDDVVFDLGSGDGRIPIAAAKTHSCRAYGFEINPELVQLSRAKVKESKVEDLVKIVEKDLFEADLGTATVITLYLGAPNNGRLLPKLRKLKPGVRIVSHAHLLGEDGPPPDQAVHLTSREDQAVHPIYLWTTPLKE